MPAITAPKSTHTKHGKLVAALANRLAKSPESAELPLVVVNQLSRTSGKHILVIWDEWKALSGAERGRIITDAYLAAHPDEQTKITVPIGVTAAEALSLGYLKYEIQALVRKEDRVTHKQISEAMKKVGGIFMQVGTEAHLRFATQSQAETAYRAVTRLFPSPIWTLVRETSDRDDQ